METKSLIDDIKVWNEKDNAERFKHERKDPENPKGMLIYLPLEDRHIALLLNTKAYSSCKLYDLYTKHDVQCMAVRIAKATLDNCSKIKTSFSSVSDGYIIKDVSDIFQEDMFTPCEEDNEFVSAICYMAQESSGKKQSSEEEYYGRVLQTMEDIQINYLEFRSCRTGSTFRPGLSDVDEDGGLSSSTEMSESSAFFGLSPARRDPKKSPDLLRLINKIRELHKCPVDIPPGFAQGATAVDLEDDDDLETDVGPDSSRKPEPAFFGEDYSESKSSKPRYFSGSPEKNNTNVGNVMFLLQTPAASAVLEMEFGTDAVLQAISSYLKQNGDAEFDVNDLITILAGEEPKQPQEASDIRS